MDREEQVDLKASQLKDLITQLAGLKKEAQKHSQTLEEKAK
jgi:hypothetical protein